MEFGPLSWRPMPLEYEAAGIIISDLDLFTRHSAKDLTLFIRTQGSTMKLWRMNIFKDFRRELTSHNPAHKKFHRKPIDGVPLVGSWIIGFQIVCATKFALGQLPVPLEAKSYTGVQCARLFRTFMGFYLCC